MGTSPEILSAAYDSSNPMHKYALFMLESENYIGSDLSPMVKAENMPWNKAVIKSIGADVAQPTSVVDLARKTAGLAPKTPGFFGASGLGMGTKTPAASVGLPPKSVATNETQNALSRVNSGAQEAIGGARGLTVGASGGAAAPAGGSVAGKVGAITAGAEFATNMVGDISQVKKNLAADEYLTDLEYWKSQGKTWFDPSSNTFPDFSEYSLSMPSAQEAMKSGSFTGHPVAEGTIGGAVKGAVTGSGIGASIGSITGSFLGPAGTLLGAAGGAVIGGAIGLVVGGITGLVSSIMGWNSSKEKDAKTKERAYANYRRDLKEWTYRKNEQYLGKKRMLNEKYKASSKAIAASVRYGKRQGVIDARQKVLDKKNNMMSVLSGIGQTSDSASQKRQLRWS